MHKRKKECTVLLLTMCLLASCTNMEEHLDTSEYEGQYTVEQSGEENCATGEYIINTTLGENLYAEAAVEMRAAQGAVLLFGVSQGA